MNSALHIKNLKDYMIYAAQNSGFGQLYKINDHLIVYNGDADSVFNWVFCHDDVSQHDVLEIIAFLKEKNWDVTWAVDQHMFGLQKILQNFEIKQLSAPKKAYLSLSSFFVSDKELGNDIKLVKVDNQEKLEIFDNYTSGIFFHKTGMVVKFLSGVLKDNKSPLQPFLVEKDKSFVGTCTIYIQDKIAGFYADGVLPKYRGQGIGSKTVLARAKLAKQMGCDHVIAHCMSASVNLYKRLGFRMLGRLPLYA